MQIFGEISGFAIAQSEEKIKGYEAELEASDAAFEKQQENLDNAIMSDETRAEKQIESQNEKEARDKVINDKIKAEKVKQAKWEKANAVVQAVIQTSLAVASALKTLNPALAVIAGIAGAIQVASILAQPIPAFAKGGITGSGLALWGEERAEIAVTPSGQTFLAEKPTISNFDAGTKIYKSVSDYENFMAGKNSQSNFKIEYDKMPQNNIILDGNGLWGIVNKENSRRTLLNRRYKN